MAGEASWAGRGSKEALRGGGCRRRAQKAANVRRYRAAIARMRCLAISSQQREPYLLTAEHGEGAGSAADQCTR
eukprot:6298441-Prymnesium_polylepis.1